MCTSKPKIPDPTPIPDPVAPVETTATDFKRDEGGKTEDAKKAPARRGIGDLRVDLNIPGGGRTGLQV